MPRLILIRHAKSDWSAEAPSDHARPLNARGRRDAPRIGAWLRQNGYLPQLILCSDAERTRETCALLQIGAPTLRADLYLPEPAAIAAALRPQTAQSIAVIAHNNGLAEFAHWIAATPPAHPRFADYPTAATTVLDLPSWGDLQQGVGQVLDFVTPHDLPA